MRHIFAVIFLSTVACGAALESPQTTATTASASASAAPSATPTITLAPLHPARPNLAAGTATPLHKAVETSNLEDVKKLIASNPEAIKAPDDKGLTPLHLACAQDNVEIVRALIAAGADINARSVRGVTPLYVAARMDKVAAAKVLLEHGADINEAGLGGPPIIMAVYRSKELVPILIAKGAHLELADAHGATALHTAATFNAVAETKQLLAAKAPIASKDENGNTPLHATSELASATSAGSIDVAKLLIAAGADAHAKNSAGQTPAELAQSKGASELATALGGH